MRNLTIRILPWVCLLILSVGLVGCSEDEPGPLPPEPEPPGPATPQALMAAVIYAYENLDFEQYRSLLHPAFTMDLQEDTRLQFPDVGTTLDFTREQRIHERMFSGEDLQDPTSGALVPGVHGISFENFTPLEAWHPVKNDDTNPEAVTCLYAVEILFDRGQSHTQVWVQGQIRFRAVSRMAAVGGESVIYYQMSGQDDLTSLDEKGTETAIWGQMKCLYR